MKLALTALILIKVIDGDTIKVDVPNVHPLFGHNLPIRLADIDTPEMFGCNADIGIKAREYLTNIMVGAKSIKIQNCVRGKYFRIVCDIMVDNKNVSSMMLESKLAKPYGDKWKCPKPNSSKEL